MNLVEWFNVLSHYPDSWRSPGLTEQQTGSIRRIWRGLPGPVQWFPWGIRKRRGSGGVRPGSPQRVDVHISCQGRSTRSRLQGRANSKMRRYLRSKPMGGHLQSPGSIFPGRAGVCQSCANVFRVCDRELL